MAALKTSCPSLITHYSSLNRSNYCMPTDPQTDVTRSEFKILRPIQTRWLDNDQYGHVNNVMYYAFFDTAINGWLMDATGVDTSKLDAIGVVAETSCRFFKAVSFPDPLCVGIKLQKLGTSSVIYDLALFRGDDSEPIAVAKFADVYVDAKTRKSIAIPAAIRAALGHLA
jgi:acyl-CoA thioester hydrolase